MFNLPYYSGKSLKDYSALFDSVYVSLWKHFNAACGAILAGDESLIEGLYHTRRMFGGALPMAWPKLAPVMQFLPTHEADCARVRAAVDQLFALLRADGRIGVRKLPDGTCRVFLSVPSTDLNAISDRVSARGVILPNVQEGKTEYPIRVNPTLLRMTPDTLARLLRKALD
jgi:threonine aldolase